MKKASAARTAKKPAKTSARRFIPYTVEMVIMQEPKPPVRHYVYVYKNGELYVIELHKEHPPSKTSRIGFYREDWIITKSKGDKAVTEYKITLGGGRVKTYNVLTRMANKLAKDIAVYEAQQEQIEKTANRDKLNRNDHYVSQVLLRRFTDKGRLQKYTLKYGKWSPSAPKKIFSEIGYNQLLAFGKFNTKLDDELKTLEDTLPVTLAALDKAAHAKSTPLDPTIYEHMCRYCAFLWEMSPFCKSVAPVNFIQQLLLHLKHGNTDFLDALGYTDDGIAQIKHHYANGSKFIITGNNYLQLIYRLQFERQLESLYKGYRQLAKWTVARSPIELPIGDMAVIKYHLPDLNIVRSILPISPTLLLIGEIQLGNNLTTSNDTVVYGGELTQSGAECMRETICQSAILTVASKTRIGDISALRKGNSIKVVQLYNVDAALKAGLTPIMSELDFLVKPVDTESYVKWTRLYLKPYSLDSTSQPN